MCTTHSKNLLPISCLRINKLLLSLPLLQVQCAENINVRLCHSLMVSVILTWTLLFAEINLYLRKTLPTKCWYTSWTGNLCDLSGSLMLAFDTHFTGPLLEQWNKLFIGWRQSIFYAGVHCMLDTEVILHGFTYFSMVWCKKSHITHDLGLLSLQLAEFWSVYTNRCITRTKLYTLA